MSKYVLDSDHVHLTGISAQVNLSGSQYRVRSALIGYVRSGRGGPARAAESEEKTRRAAEREGRRRARRLQREAAASAAGAALPHRDGDSSDDELPPAELHHYAHERGTFISFQAYCTKPDSTPRNSLPADETKID